MKVRWRELALSDLDRIFRYLDERSPAGAPNGDRCNPCGPR
jgi:plasmid stabilization system protein ParE